MAELDRSLSQMDATTTIPTGSLFFVSVEDQQAASGYASKKITSENVGNQLLTAYNFNSLNTASKNVIGAVNELKGTELTAVLSAGSTAVTISNVAILTTSTVDIYTDVFGVNPEAVTVTTGQIVLTFPEQENNLNVKVVIR